MSRSPRRAPSLPLILRDLLPGAAAPPVRTERDAQRREAERRRWEDERADEQARDLKYWRDENGIVEITFIQVGP